uniref:Ovule protein n=1 Tax=Heterorhabditis bacteriophora TaxID=37862 RepID=A0A1I7WUH9_HETBA
MTVLKSIDRRQTVCSVSTVFGIISNDIDDSSRTNEIEGKETSWGSIYLLTAICMFCGVQFYSVLLLLILSSSCSYTLLICVFLDYLI